jgi:hypothetical protein
MGWLTTRGSSSSSGKAKDRLPAAEKPRPIKRKGTPEDIATHLVQVQGGSSEDLSILLADIGKDHNGKIVREEQTIYSYGGKVAAQSTVNRETYSFSDGEVLVEALMTKAAESSDNPAELKNAMDALEKLCSCDKVMKVSSGGTLEDIKLADTATQWLSENPFEATKMRDACDDNDITMPQPIDDWIRERSPSPPTMGR